MAGKFSKEMVTTAPDRSAFKNILTGGPNAGKTYFASTIDNVFIIPIEEGLKGASPNHEPGHFKAIPENLGELSEALDSFALDINAPAKQGDRSTMPYRHLVLDSLSGIEKLIHADACRSEGAKHMENAEYQKVWRAAIPFWESFQARLDRIRRTGVHIWIIAHAVEDYAADPIKGDVFKAWDLMLKGNGKMLAEVRHLWRAWADNIFYIVKTHEVRKGDKTRRATSQFKGRILITQEMAGFAAKSRGNLPPNMPATWADLKRAWEANIPAKPEKLLAQIQALIPSLLDEDRALIEQDLARAKTPTQLSAVLSRAEGMAQLAAQERGQEEDDEAPVSGARGPVDDVAMAAAIDAGRA
ncbi:AAA family ATPase [Sorangium sp. So ce233]|uniref:AAA family ATPase n=1 Tax=Sorangium sp. So ce233 TaxID=3133290 RepID=UPI003F62757D